MKSYTSNVAKHNAYVVEVSQSVSTHAKDATFLLRSTFATS